MTLGLPSAGNREQLPQDSDPARPAARSERQVSTKVNKRNYPKVDKSTTLQAPATQDSKAQTRVNAGENASGSPRKTIDYSGKTCCDLLIIERKGMGRCPVSIAGNASR